MSASDRHDVVGPDVALSAEDRETAEAIVEALSHPDRVTTKDLHPVRNGERVRVADPTNFTPCAGDVGLPGFGSAYDGSDGRTPCGAEIPHVCEDCGSRVDVGSTCARSRCPRCGARWVTKRAPKLVSRIVEAAAMMSAASDGSTPVYKHHVVLSPPTDWMVDDDDPTEALIEVAHDWMEAVGMEGIIAVHPFRGRESSHEDDRGEWKNRLFAGRDWEGDVAEELELRPHVHIIGACEWVPGGDVVEAVHEETGWVQKRITERNGSAVSLGDITSVARAVTYALSHVGIDTSGDRNRALFRRHGSAFANADLRRLDEAKAAVNAVAPDTLGVSIGTVECRDDVLDDDQEELPDQEPPDEDGDVDDQEASADEETPTRTCRGDLADVEDAREWLDEDDDRTRPWHRDRVEALRDLVDEWDRVGGWRGWVDPDQAVLDEDTPPPD